jgi:DME family drug/metabolite transporter
MVLLTRDTAASPLFVGFSRLAVAAPILLIAAWSTGGFGQWRWRKEGRVCLVLGACMAAYQIGYFWAVPHAGVAVTALVTICSSPLFIVGLAASYLGERPTPRLYAALALGIVGTGLLAIEPRGIDADNGSFLLGVVLALGAGFSYALYAVVTKARLAQLAPLPLAAVSFTAAAFFLSPALLVEPELTQTLARGWHWLLYLGAVPTGIAYALYNTGLRHTPATVAGIVVLLEPLTATLIGVLGFGERMGVMGSFGAILLLGAIALLTFRRSWSWVKSGKHN